MSWLLLIPAAYQILALLACFRHLRRRLLRPWTPHVSVLKPVDRLTGRVRCALRSNEEQDYPHFELLTAGSSAIGLPNPKMGKIVELAARATGEVLVISDADIAVPRDYLRRILSELDEPGVGLVTCLYRASGDSRAAQFEALGVATEFAPGALVAPMMGAGEFGLGSTLAFRRALLDRLDLADVGRYLADDYQIGRRIAKLGLRVRMSAVVVETHLGGGGWRDVWRHQVRWARTIRLSRGAYAGLPVANASVWAIVALLSGLTTWSATLLVLRLAAGLAAGVLILRCPITARWWWLMPVRDLWGFAVWLAGMAGREVYWSGRLLRLDGKGRIIPE